VAVPEFRLKGPLPQFQAAPRFDLQSYLYVYVTPAFSRLKLWCSDI
jgi:hypothetical protein